MIDSTTADTEIQPSPDTRLTANQMFSAFAAGVLASKASLGEGFLFEVLSAEWPQDRISDVTIIYLSGYWNQEAHTVAVGLAALFPKQQKEVGIMLKCQKDLNHVPYVVRGKLQFAPADTVERYKAEGEAAR